MKAALVAALAYTFTEARKAVVAFAGGALTGGLTGLQAAIQLSSDGGVNVTHDEWTTIAGAALVGGLVLGLAVFGVANKPAP